MSAQIKTNDGKEQAVIFWPRELVKRFYEPRKIKSMGLS